MPTTCMSVSAALIPGAFALASTATSTALGRRQRPPSKRAPNWASFSRDAYNDVVMADLAAGDAGAAGRPPRPPRRASRMPRSEALTGGAWLTPRWLAATQSARRWAVGAVTATSGMFRRLALEAMARIDSSKATRSKPHTDAYEALAIAVPMSGYVCVPGSPGLPSRVGPQCRQLPTCGSVSPARRPPCDSASDWCASRFMTMTTTHRCRHCGTPWATPTSRKHGRRERVVDRRGDRLRPAGSRGTQATVDRLGLTHPQPNSTWCASSAKACRTRTSPPGSSSRRVRCNHTCGTSTTRSA